MRPARVHGEVVSPRCPVLPSTEPKGSSVCPAPGNAIPEVRRLRNDVCLWRNRVLNPLNDEAFTPQRDQGFAIGVNGT